MPDSKQRAPTLYAIIALKLAKATLLMALAFGVHQLAGNNLPDLFAHALRWIHLDPENKFFSKLAEHIGSITAANIRWVAAGTLFYSFFSFVEGIGLIFRVTWAGWMAIGESAFFVPIEIYKLVKAFSVTVTVILIINVIIVWYLFVNRHRLFHHAHFGLAKS